MKNKNLAKLLAVAMALGMSTAAFTACDQLANIPVIGDLINAIMPAATVTISQSTAEILVGETVQLTATASDGSDVEWESSDKTIATVRDGLVRGAKAGKVTITAKVGEATATCEVTVSEVGVTISKKTAEVEKGETLTLTAEADDDGAITWSSSDESIATVKDGVVTGLKEGTVTITARRGLAGSASCEVTVIWSSKPTDYAEIVFGEETVAKGNPGTWYFWNDQNWTGSNVTAVGAYIGGGVATFQYADASPACWHGYQIFYDNAANVEGQAYKLTAKINSLEEGDITINGTVVTLKKGDNNVEVYYTEGNGAQASISIQCGNQAENTVISANTLAISDIKFEEFAAEKLATPTEVSIENNVVSVTDPTDGKADAIKLNFYLNGDLKASLSVKDGDTIDNSAMEDGTYDVKAIAVGSGAYASSDESDVLTTYTVANGGVVYDMENQTEEKMMANPGKYVYWSETGTIANAKYENGVVSYEVTSVGPNWYSNQIFYKNTALTVNAAYTLKMTITSSVAGDITINGQVVSLVEGENEISLSVTEGTKASLSIQMGVYATGEQIAGTFSIADIAFEAVDGGNQGGNQGGTTTPEQPETEYSDSVAANISELVKGGEGDAQGNAGKLYYWYAEDLNWNCGGVIAVSEAKWENGVLSLTYQAADAAANAPSWFGVQLFYKDASHTAGTQYKLTLTINSAVAGDITVNGKVVTLVAGENKVEVEYTEGGSSLSIQMGNEAAGTFLDNNTITISDIAYAAEVTEGGNQGEEPETNYEADLDNSFESEKELAKEFGKDTEGTATDGSTPNASDNAPAGSIGGLDKLNKYVTYTFTVAEEGYADFIWNIAGNAWNGSGNSGLTDAGNHLNVTIDGKKVDVAGIALPAGDGTNTNVWWNLQQVVIKDVKLTAGEHTLSCTIISDGSGLNVGLMEFYFEANSTVDPEPVEKEILVTGADIVVEGEKVYYVFTFKNVGYTVADYEFFDEQTIYPIVDSKFEGETAIIKIDVTDLAVGATINPHLRVAGENYVNGENANGDLRGDALVYEQKVIQANGKLYQLYGNWSMPSFKVVELAEKVCMIIGADVVVEGDKVYLLYTYANVGYDPAKYEFFDGSLVLPYTYEVNGVMVTFKFDVTNVATAQFYPHLKIDGATFDGSSNGDVKLSTHQYQNQKEVTLNGKSYKLENAWDMPTLIVAEVTA